MGGPSGTVRLEQIHSLVEAAEEDARERERRVILDWLALIRPPQSSAEWKAGFDEGLSAAIDVVLERSQSF